jgi:hypothetical protein
VVREIDALLATDWYSQTDELLTSSRELSDKTHRDGHLLCEVARSGPAFKIGNNLALFNTLIYFAQRAGSASTAPTSCPTSPSSPPSPPPPAAAWPSSCSSARSATSS